MQKRIIMIVLCVAFAMLPFSFIAHADVIDISTPLYEPVPIYEVVNGQIHVRIFWVEDVSGITQLVRYDGFFDSNTHFYVGTNGMFRFDHQPSGGQIDRFRMSDGVFISTSSAAGVQYNQTVGNLASPNYFKWVKPYTGSFYYVPDSNFTVQGLTEQVYNITWATPLPFVHTYKSFVSEPVCDELNRYFVLAGDDEQYLYCIHYFLSEAVGIQTEFANDPNNSYQYAIRNLFCPHLDLNNYGLQLSIACDADLITLINQGNDNAAISYDIQVSQYNLQDGEYVASYVFTDILLVDDTIPLNISFGDYTRFDSIKTWGVMYQDTSTSYHYNYLNCTWALDPDFILWQDQMLALLNDIYQSMIDAGSEEATINDDMSGYNEMDSARNDLQVTDAGGSVVDPAAQVEVAFSGAAEGIGDLADGVSSINGIISDIIGVHPLVIVPLIVALALGLLVTMLGKDKSD